MASKEGSCAAKFNSGGCAVKRRHTCTNCMRPFLLSGVTILPLMSILPALNSTSGFCREKKWDVIKSLKWNFSCATRFHSQFLEIKRITTRLEGFTPQNEQKMRRGKKESNLHSVRGAQKILIVPWLRPWCVCQWGCRRLTSYSNDQMDGRVARKPAKFVLWVAATLTRILHRSEFHRKNLYPMQKCRFEILQRSRPVRKDLAANHFSRFREQFCFHFLHFFILFFFLPVGS